MSNYFVPKRETSHKLSAHATATLSIYDDRREVTLVSHRQDNTVHGGNYVVRLSGEEVNKLVRVLRDNPRRQPRQSVAVDDTSTT